MTRAAGLQLLLLSTRMPEAEFSTGLPSREPAHRSAEGGNEVVLTIWCQTTTLLAGRFLPMDLLPKCTSRIPVAPWSEGRPPGNPRPPRGRSIADGHRHRHPRWIPPAPRRLTPTIWWSPSTMSRRRSAVAKTADPTEAAEPGDSVTFSVDVTNNALEQHLRRRRQPDGRPRLQTTTRSSRSPTSRRP